MRILGISAFYHDSAAALVEDGRIIAAVQEERFTRIKHDSRFPAHAIGYCLAEAGITLADIDHVAFYEKPFIKFERLLETYLANAPHGYQSFRMAMPLWLREKLFQKKLLADELKDLAPSIDWNTKLLFAEHHQSHAASAFYPSPFEEALVLTMDGVGEWATTTAAIGKDAKLEIFKEIHFPHSLGLLYSAFTYFCGFKVNSGEYKLMGLAPYGTAKYRDVIFNHLIDVKDDGSFRLDMRYFDYATGLTMTNSHFAKLFGIKARNPDEPLTQVHMDLAASIQQVLEEVVLALARSLQKETGQKNLCLAGGVALNCVANGKLLKEKIFSQIWVQPAAGDAGGALGAALCAYHGFENRPRLAPMMDRMQGSYLGCAYAQDVIERALAESGAVFATLKSDEELVAKTAEALASGKAIGWFQGRMEFGPRALGNRSIIADPRSRDMQKTLNLKIKYRESFRPFAPSVLRERVGDWFELDEDSPYMLQVACVRPDHRIAMNEQEQALFGIEKLNVARSDIPAVTHVDYSARIQTVQRDTNPLYHALLTEFERITGCPVLVNTSFNVRGEPIVCTPQDAFRCFMGCELDLLVMGRCWLEKTSQNPELRFDYQHRFAPD